MSILIVTIIGLVEMFLIAGVIVALDQHAQRQAWARVARARRCLNEQERALAEKEIKLDRRVKKSA